MRDSTTLLSEAASLDLSRFRQPVPGAIPAADARGNHGGRYSRLLPAFEHGRRQNGFGALMAANALRDSEELAKRHMVVKSGSRHHQEVLVPNVAESDADYVDLYNRCRADGRDVAQTVNRKIRQRHQLASRRTGEVLNDWE